LGRALNNDLHARSVDRAADPVCRASTPIEAPSLRCSTISVLTLPRDTPSLNVRPARSGGIMSMHRKKVRSPEDRAAMFKFLDAFDNHTYSNDVGCLLGQLSWLRERVSLDHADERTWHKAVSLAVTAH
jgi:hypothetical protein